MSTELFPRCGGAAARAEQELEPAAAELVELGLGLGWQHRVYTCYISANIGTGTSWRAASRAWVHEGPSIVGPDLSKERDVVLAGAQRAEDADMGRTGPIRPTRIRSSRQ